MRAYTEIAGGIGLFLLGITLLTEGLKALAGTALRGVLLRHVSSPLSGAWWGMVTTALVQSSSATTMTTIGFVSAGLLSFRQALGVIVGANVGTTATAWIVALLGYKLSLATFALPMMLVGAVMRLAGGARTAAAGTAIAGFALLLVGLSMLQGGLVGLEDRFSPESLPQETGMLGAIGSRAVLVGLGILTTLITQSSSAAMAGTLAALHAGSISLEQAAAMVIGQSVGTAFTSAVAAIGGTTPAKRTAAAHVIFNAIAGVAVFMVLPLAVRMLELTAEALSGSGAGGADEHTIALALFLTSFKVAGAAIFLPLVDFFAWLVERIVPQRGPELTKHLDRTVARLGPVATEAARRAAAEIGQELCGVSRDLLKRDGLPAQRQRLSAVEEAVERSREFMATLDPPADGEAERRASVLHALDHLSRLTGVARHVPPREAISGLPQEAAALDALLEQAERRFRLQERRDPEQCPALAEIATASRALAEMRRAGRAKLLADAGARRLATDEAIARSDALRWLDRMGYHAWRAAHHAARPDDPADDQEREERLGTG